MRCMEEVPLKHCPTCPGDNQWHPATTEYFYRSVGNADGLEGKCKKCRSEQSKANYSRPEVKERKSMQTKVYQSRPEIRERRRASEQERCTRPEVQEKNRASQKKYHSLHREKRNAFSRTFIKGYTQRPEVRIKRRA